MRPVKVRMSHSDWLNCGVACTGCVYRWPPAATACNIDQSQSCPRNTVLVLTLIDSAYIVFMLAVLFLYAWATSLSTCDSFVFARCPCNVFLHDNATLNINICTTTNNNNNNVDQLAVFHSLFISMCEDQQSQCISWYIEKIFRITIQNWRNFFLMHNVARPNFTIMNS